MHLLIVFSAKVSVVCLFVVVVLEIIDASLNHVPVQKNEETTENGIHPELAKVINACYVPDTQPLHPLSEKGIGP